MTTKQASVLALLSLLSAATVKAAMDGGFGGGGASATNVRLGTQQRLLWRNTVAKLPHCGETTNGLIAIIEDAQDQQDTAVGGGTTMLLAVCDGRWLAVRP